MLTKMGLDCLKFIWEDNYIENVTDYFGLILSTIGLIILLIPTLFLDILILPIEIIVLITYELKKRWNKWKK